MTEILTYLGKDQQYEKYELFFGPNHPGMHGNFSYILTVEGHTIKKVDPDPGLLHRGFEKLAERRKWMQNIALIPRICVPEPDINEVIYSIAVEKLMGVEVPLRAQYIRTIILEMARIGSFLFGFGGIGGATGLYTASYWSFSDRDYLLDLFEWLTGARVYHMFIIPGGVRRDLPSGWTDKLSETVDYLQKRLYEYDRLIYNNPLIVKRLTGIGKLTKEEAIEYGITGPNLRATGVKYDTRKMVPYAAYDRIDFEIPIQTEGDGLARAIQKREEFQLSLDIIKKAIKDLPDGPVRAKMPNPLKFKVPKGEVYVKIESSRGEHAYYIVSDGSDKPYRMAVRGGSYTAGLVLAQKILVGMRIEDVALWMATMDICPPDFDR
ncbi:MAG: NADH-quinone oxidoreductase subunit D [candidate division WOR-3 bacterium]